MKRIVTTLAILAMTAALPALAQTTSPNASTPSAQNSGTGIQGQPGNKSGPPAQRGTTTGSSSDSQNNEAVRQQDASKVKGLPGNKSGPPAKRPSQQ
jgi:hypothetical protein